MSTILHVDLDAFYAAVEQRDHPELRGRPVIVGGSATRGVVCAASYEARPYGVRSAMPMAEALRRCPHAVVVAIAMPRYAAASRQLFAILDAFSPQVEPLSLDEGFLDVTGQRRLLGDGSTIARRIKRRVADELGLIASVGVAPNKFLAKIASDIDKPDGLRVIEPGGERAFLEPLPVSRLWGVGAVTQERLAALGLGTIGQVARYPEALLKRALGAGAGAHLAALARGDDPREVVSERAPVSIGHEQTFDVDLERAEDLVELLLGQADRVAARLRQRCLRARTVTLKIKYADFRSLSRRRTLDDATSDGTVIGRTAVALLGDVPIDSAHGKARRVRLCGVAAAGLEARDAPRQLTLYEPQRARGERLGDTIDAIAARFGDGTVRRAIKRSPDDDPKP